MRRFTLSALTLALFIFAAGVPSPLYAIFQQQFHFSSLLLTVIFAAYAFSFVVALLFAGKLSDYVGRRPVLVAVLVLEIVSMLVFTDATGVWWLIAARLFQGVATGIASVTLSAQLLDTEPETRPGFAGIVTTIVPVASIGMGSFIASLFVTYMAWPTHLVFWIMIVLALVLLAATALNHETRPPRPGWQKALKPRIMFPAEARHSMRIMGPSLIACWALIGFYLSLGPSVALSLLGEHGHVLGGLLALGLTTPAALCMYRFRNLSNSKLALIGNLLACLGLMLTVYSVLVSAPILFLASTVIAGAGFGPAFMSAFRSIMAHAKPTDRAALASAVHIISYVAFGVPVVTAGVLLGSIHLRTVTLGYTTTVIMLYAYTLLSSRAARAQAN